MRGATEGVNLVAWSFARPRLEPGDEVVVSEMEHHSNIVPWQLVCQATGARLRVAPMDDRGELDLEALTGLLGERTRVLAVGHVSNALGTVNPIKEIIRLARRFDVAVVVGRRPGRAAPDGGRAGPGLRLLRLLRAQALRAHRCGRGLRQARPSAGHAALAGRRRHDPVGDLRRDDLRRASDAVRGRHAAHRRWPSAWARPSTTSKAWATSTSPPTSRTCWPTERRC